MSDAWDIANRDDNATPADADAWNNFTAGLNPVVLEGERMRPPSNPEHERPHSAEDIRMRSRHHQVVTAFYIRKEGHVIGPFTPLQELEARLVRDREEQIAAYGRRKQHAACGS